MRRLDAFGHNGTVDHCRPASRVPKLLDLFDWHSTAEKVIAMSDGTGAGVLLNTGSAPAGGRYTAPAVPSAAHARGRSSVARAARLCNSSHGYSFILAARSQITAQIKLSSISQICLSLLASFTIYNQFLLPHLNITYIERYQF